MPTKTSGHVRNGPTLLRGPGPRRVGACASAAKRGPSALVAGSIVSCADLLPIAAVLRAVARDNAGHNIAARILRGRGIIHGWQAGGRNGPSGGPSTNSRQLQN